MRSVLLLAACAAVAVQSQAPPQFGGGYATLDTTQRALIDDWVGRFKVLTDLQLTPAAFYDTHLRVSARTTFEAVTHALKTTALTDDAGAALGDALALIERLDTVKGQVTGAAGDHQFRLFVRLKAGALDALERSREFKRGVDNSIFHKGYPVNYREQGGSPSIQISSARDGRQADIDVDYRASRFPRALFNGHLTSANSDVRAGSNYDSHVNRWSGFQNWWRSFLGIRVGNTPEDKTGTALIPDQPRAGNKGIDTMVGDFLRAWLVDGDARAAASYVSERAFACLAEENDDPASFDRGMAPVELVLKLKASQAALGPHTALEGLIVGIRLTTPGLRVVSQPHHAQYVIYEVPDDIAMKFDCTSRQTIGAVAAPRRYGQYYGTTFFVDGPGRDVPIALLWGRDRGFWKIVSWQTEPDDDDTPAPPAAAAASSAHVTADSDLVKAAKDFLESWLVRKDYDRAFGYLSEKSYACYELVRGPDEPAAASAAEAAKRIRASLAAAGDRLGRIRNLDGVIGGAMPVLDVVRIADHPYSRSFTLTSIPDAVADAMDCRARASGARLPATFPLEYGRAFGMNVRFATRSGEAPVLRLLWLREPEGWRIAGYDVELP